MSAPMAAPAPAPQTDLARQLASLHVPRDPAPRSSGPGWIAALAVVALIAAAAAAAYAFRDRWETKSAETAPVVLVQPGQEPPLFVATGTVAAPVTATLAPRTAGRLDKVLVQEGDEVAEGQPVGLLDATDFRLADGQARADLASAEAKAQAAAVALEAAEVRAKRAAKLLAGGAGTGSAAEDAALDVDGARAQLQVAKADVGLARARLATADRAVQDATLRAPFHGIVLRVLAQPGDFVSTAGGQGAVQLADLSSLEVDAEVAEVNLGKLRVGMPVEVRLDAWSDRGLAGRVFSVRPNVDPAKATAIAKVRLAPPAAGTKLTLYPGMNGRVSFLDRAPDPAALARAPQLELPAAAIVQGPSGATVLTVDAQGRVAAVPVTASGTDGDRAILTKGPAAGTLVVVTPEGIQPGDRIRLPTDK